MKLKFKYLTAILLFTISGHNIWAQETISLEECRIKAVNFNKELKKAKYQVGEAEAQREASKTLRLPSLSAEASLMHISGLEGIHTDGAFLPTAESAEEARKGNFTGLSDVWMPGYNIELDNITMLNGGLTVSQAIYAGGKITNAIKMADEGVEMAGLNFDLKQSEIIEKTDQAFWNVAMIESQIKLAEKYIEMLTETEDLMTRMYELGLQPASEKLKVTVQKNEAELQLFKARNGLRIAKMNLNQILGNELQAEIEIAYDTMASFNLTEMANGVEMAMNNRNELRLMDKKLTLSKLEQKLTMADYLPQLGVGMQYSSYYVNDFYEDIKFNPIIAAELSIPVFQWGQGKKKKQAAHYKILQNETELSNTADLIKLEVEHTRIKLEEAYKEILLAELNINEAKQSLEETSSSFEVGLNTTNDLLNAQAIWLKANIQKTTAIAQYKILETKWLKVTGNLNTDKN